MDWAVILAGGSGLRFWPLSSPARPKQLLPLAGARSTAEETLDRLAGFIPAARTLIVTGAALAVTTLRHAEQFGGACRSGPFHSAVFEFGVGPAILSALSPGATLVILAHADRDLGPLLYELRQKRDVLTGLL